MNPPPRNSKSSPSSSRRRWLVRLLALAILPLLLLLLEGGLRLCGYGHATGFFEKIRARDREFLVNNEDFSLRFFPPEMARWPGPFMMAAAKPAGAIRIFIFGESAAMGDPEPAFGAARYLEMLLRERFPGQQFEIINTAITAINSNVILPIARECARQHGDLWIIYMGNNEMVGPFGAATVFGAKAPPLSLIRLNLAIQKSRVGQCLAALGRKLKGAAPSISWGGMQMFLNSRVAPDSPRRESVYRNFRRNLDDIVRAGLNANARIILCTVAVNLRDCPPFGSMANSNLPAADREACDRRLAEATRAAERGDFGAATAAFADAAKFDSRRADLHFRWAECLSLLTNHSAARAHFQLACDADALPFRADSRINGLIRQTASTCAGKDLVLLDAEAALAARSPAGICGSEIFYEHVHFNFDGNYLLARAWAEQVEVLLPETVRGRAAGDWATQAVCERRMALTDWNRSFVLQSVLKRFQQPPLSSQANNARRREALQNRLAELTRQMNPAAATNARAIYEEAIARAPEDPWPRESFSDFLQTTGDLPGAIAQYRRVHELLPRDYLADFQLGRLLAKQGQWSEAQSALLRSLSRHAAFAEGWFELGNARFGEAKYGAALQDYDRARQLQPHDPRIYCQMGKAYSLTKRSAEAIENFQQAIRLNPDFWEARYALGGELGAHDRVEEAKAEFEAVVRLQPAFAMGHFNLGVALLKLNQPEGAVRQFEETLRLDPGNQLARDYSGRARALQARGSNQTHTNKAWEVP